MSTSDSVNLPFIESPWEENGVSTIARVGEGEEWVGRLGGAALGLGKDGARSTLHTF